MEILVDVQRKFPDLKVLIQEIHGLSVSEADPRLEQFKKDVCAEVRRSFTLEGLKDEPVFRAYRDFFWRIRVDPTKTRPAAEALIRRVLGGRPLPRINTVVDAYNLSSMITLIALAAFDTDRINGNMIMRFADKDEEFLGIGMGKPMILAGGEVLIADESRLLAIYPHRDADYSKITIQTKNIVIISCGVPGIPQDKLKESISEAYDIITRFAMN
jgi:DNA/RNA-binding domain of Phe-tRNA-synthetase-like protein